MQQALQLHHSHSGADNPMKLKVTVCPPASDNVLFGIRSNISGFQWSNVLITTCV